MKRSRREFLKKSAVIASAALSSNFIGINILHAENRKIELTFSTMFPESYFWVPVAKRWVKYIEDKTNGAVKINFFDSGQLFTAKAELPALERGEIDISIPNANYQSGSIPGSDVGALPFLIKNEKSGWKVIKAGLWDQGLNQKWMKKNIKVLAQAPAGLYQFGNLRHPVRVPEDVKGLIWAVSSEAHAKAVEVLGGSPTFMSSSRLYTALQRKTIDGCLRPYLTYSGRKLYEVMKYLSITNAGNYTIVFAMNNKKFASMPNDIKKIFEDSAWKWAQWAEDDVMRTKADSLVLFEKKGMKIDRLDAEVLAQFKSKMPPVYNWWLSKVPDGKKYIDFIEKHQ